MLLATRVVPWDWQATLVDSSGTARVNEEPPPASTMADAPTLLPRAPIDDEATWITPSEGLHGSRVTRQ